jgi:hypothetical protein
MSAVPTGLVPFDKESARQAGLKSAEARRVRKLARAADVEQVATEVRKLVVQYERHELGPMAFAACADLVGRVVRGDIPVRNGSEAADLMRALVDIGRLESGDAQRTVAVAHLTGPALAQRLRELQRVDVVSSAASTADDTGPTS